MSNRFHNKYHKNNHHTASTASDVDSALDPIASPDNPFLGSFNVSGDIAITGDYSVSAPSGEFTNGYFTEISVDIIGSLSASDITISNDLDIGSNFILNLDLHKLSNVANSVSGAIDNDTIRYNAITSEWEAYQLSADMATDAEAISGLATDKSINPVQLHFVDTEYIPLITGTTGLTQTTNNTYTYYISAFDGIGLDTTEIRGIYIESQFSGGTSSYYVKATMPDSTLIYVSKLNGYGGSGGFGLSYIPINKGQQSIDIELYKSGGSAQFTILGATQRVFQA